MAFWLVVRGPVALDAPCKMLWLTETRSLAVARATALLAWALVLTRPICVELAFAEELWVFTTDWVAVAELAPPPVVVELWAIPCETVPVTVEAACASELLVCTIPVARASPLVPGDAVFSPRDAVVLEAGVPSLQFQFQLQDQLQLQGSLRSQLDVVPSGSVHVQAQLHVPDAAVPDGSETLGGSAAAVVQLQFQVELEVGAAEPAPGSFGLQPESQAQLQAQGLDPVGMTTAVLSPGKTTETLMFCPPVWMQALGEDPGLPDAAATSTVQPFCWLTGPSLPGLATRTETLTFFAPLCVALAELVPEVGPACAPAVPVPPGSEGAGGATGWPCVTPWSIEPALDVSAMVAVSPASVLPSPLDVPELVGGLPSGAPTPPADALTWFVWLTAPLSPGLPTLTETRTLLGSV